MCRFNDGHECFDAGSGRLFHKKVLVKSWLPRFVMAVMLDVKSACKHDIIAANDTEAELNVSMTDRYFESHQAVSVHIQIQDH